MKIGVAGTWGRMREDAEVGATGSLQTSSILQRELVSRETPYDYKKYIASLRYGH